jgi:hypothetical protein
VVTARRTLSPPLDSGSCTPNTSKKCMAYRVSFELISHHLSCRGQHLRSKHVSSPWPWRGIPIDRITDICIVSYDASEVSGLLPNFICTHVTCTTGRQHDDAWASWRRGRRPPDAVRRCLEPSLACQGGAGKRAMADGVDTCIITRVVTIVTQCRTLTDIAGATLTHVRLVVRSVRAATCVTTPMSY